MKWTVLGFQSPFPGADGATPGYLLEAKEKKILIDCGSGVLAQLAKRMPADALDAVILSHLHADHFSDIWVLQHALLIAQRNQKDFRPLPIWMPNQPRQWFQAIQAKPLVKVQVLREGRTIDLGEDLTITCYRTDHSIPCFAMKISDGKSTILYGADSGPDTRWEQMGVEHDLVILEATFLNENLPSHPTGHLSARQAGEIAEAMKAKSLLLTHFFPTYDYRQVVREAQERYSGNCMVARKGLTIEIGKRNG